MNSTTITVASNEELSSAIETLSSTGGTIIVKGNDTLYEISKYARGPEDGTLTIVSEDPENPANFGQIKLTGSQNFTFDSIKMDSSADTDTYQASLVVNYSDGIVFKNSTFISYANGFYAGEEGDLSGFKLGSVRASEGFQFINNTVDSYHQGITIIDSSDMVIADNSFTRMTADGLRLSGVQDMLIEGNSFTDFYGSKNTLNHDDMIQVWSAAYNTQNTENLTIRGNYFNSGTGETTQTIFMRNEMFPTTGETYKNITIENNVIYNAHSHAITVSDAENVSVTNNTLLFNEGSTHGEGYGYTAAPKVNLFDVFGGVVTNNIGQVSTKGGDDLTVENNVTPNYTSHDHENYIGNHFVNWGPFGDLDLRDLTLRAESDWAGVYGATLDMEVGSSDSSVTAVMQQTHTNWAEGIVTYDASLSYDANGLLSDVANNQFIWLFSDGELFFGPEVTRDFDEPGVYAAMLIVRSGSEYDMITRHTEYRDTELLNVDFDNGVEDASSYETQVWLEGTEYEASGWDGSDAFYLDGYNEFHAAKASEHLQNLDQFTISVSVNKDEDGLDGLLLHMHRGLDLNITSNGAIKLGFATSEGYFGLETLGGVIEEGQWQRLSLSYDGVGGDGLTIYVDGQKVGSIDDAAGTFQSTGRYDLVLGNTWNRGMQGVVDDLEVSAVAQDQLEIANDYIQKQQLAAWDADLQSEDVADDTFVDSFYFETDNWNIA